MNHSIESLYEKYLNCRGVSTDTRDISQGSLFIALKGPNFDANTFALEALEKGAQLALIDDPKYQVDPRLILVENGLQALQNLAKYHRSQLSIPIVAITGSNGKTTTKELIQVVLKQKYQTLATLGNLNNHIGVPLTILSIKEAVEIAIIEMGANHLGEITELCAIAQPTHGLITNIGQAHLEGFGGIDGVIRGKSELYSYLILHHGVVFINSQDPILGKMAKRFDKPYFYPAEQDYIHLSYLGADPYVNFRNEKGKEIKTQLIGGYNFSNLAAALCIGKYFQVAPGLAEQAVADYVPQNNRSQVVRKNTNSIILDAYNANPSSMSAALENLQALQASNKVAILGDMLELGAESQYEHRRLGELTRKGLDQVYFCGHEMKAALELNPKAIHFNNREQLGKYLKQNPIANSTILIKGSRGMGLEAVMEFI